MLSLSLSISLSLHLSISPSLFLSSHASIALVLSLAKKGQPHTCVCGRQGVENVSKYERERANHTLTSRSVSLDIPKTKSTCASFFTQGIMNANTTSSKRRRVPAKLCTATISAPAPRSCKVLTVDENKIDTKLLGTIIPPIGGQVKRAARQSQILKSRPFSSKWRKIQI